MRLSEGETGTRMIAVGHWWITCLGELVLLGLAAAQLLVDLLQRLSLHDDPLTEPSRFNAIPSVRNVNRGRGKQYGCCVQRRPHLFLLRNSLVLFFQLLHLKGQIVGAPRLLRQLPVQLLDLSNTIRFMMYM